MIENQLEAMQCFYELILSHGVHVNNRQCHGLVQRLNIRQ
jgi:hypothetical protein